MRTSRSTSASPAKSTRSITRYVRVHGVSNFPFYAHLQEIAKRGYGAGLFHCFCQTLYAPPGHKDEVAFNSVQRAHQNTLETYSLVMLQMMCAGLKYPVTSAACGATYVVGRVIYGYGEREGRGASHSWPSRHARKNARDTPQNVQVTARRVLKGGWPALLSRILATFPSYLCASRWPMTCFDRANNKGVHLANHARWHNKRGCPS
jgi:hypothetical protein